jgi:poly(hydroxyalkanoate) granule-associated protein
MVKKVQDVDGQGSQSVQESAHLIWLAGLGASAKVSAEGSKLFDALVAEGAKIEEQTRAARASAVKAVGERTDETRGKMTNAWDKVEQIFEDRLARVLGRLGMPNRDDLLELTQRVDALNAQLDALRKARDNPP